MDKPFSLVINEFRGRIEAAIGECGLSPVITAPIVENYALRLRELAREQTIADAQKEKAEGSEG